MTQKQKQGLKKLAEVMQEYNIEFYLVQDNMKQSTELTVSFERCSLLYNISQIQTARFVGDQKRVTVKDILKLIE